MRIAGAALLVLVSSSLAGCVKQALYNEAVSDIDQLREQLSDCQVQRHGFRKDLGECRQEAQALRDRNGDLIGRLKALNQDVSRLEEQRETLSKDLDDATRKARELERQQRLAQARLDTFRRLLDRFRAMIESGQVQVKVERGRMVVKMPSAILFDSGRTDIKPTGKDVLKNVAQVLAEIPDRSFQVEGHTDDQPIATARFPSNWELSTARATEVVQFMVAQGMAPARISAAGYSQFQPVAANDSPDGRAQNRRIDVVLLPNLDELPDLSELTRKAD